MNNKKYAIGLLVAASLILTSCGEDKVAKYDQSLASRIDLGTKNSKGSKYWFLSEEKSFAIEISVKNKLSVPVAEDLTFYAETKKYGNKGPEWEYYKVLNIYDLDFNFLGGDQLLVDLNPGESRKVIVEFKVPYKKFVSTIFALEVGVKIDPNDKDAYLYRPSQRISGCWDLKGIRFGFPNDRDCPYTTS